MRDYFLAAFAAVCLASPNLRAYAGVVSGNANLELGQPDFNHNIANVANSSSLNSPNGIAFDRNTGRVFVADSYNNRVLLWNNYATLINGQAADGVLGQPDFLHNVAGAISTNTLASPSQLTVDASGNLWVADSFFHRVLRFSPPFSSGMNANLVLGEPDFVTPGPVTIPENPVSQPYGIALDSFGNVWVSDSVLYCIHRYSPPFSNGMSSNLTIGQCGSIGLSANAFINPTSIFIDPSNNLWVADPNDNRVLRFSPPFYSGMNADLVLGQPDFTSGSLGTFGTSTRQMWGPNGVFVDSMNTVWVADEGNSRVLGFAPPFFNGMNANFVIGQPDFASQGYSPVTANSLKFPLDVTGDPTGGLWVSDSFNGRVLRYDPLFSTGMSASLVLGQANLNQASTGNSTAHGLSQPSAGFVDSSGNLWAADPGNNRVLRFTPPFSNEMNADLVLMQADFGGTYANTTQNGGFFPRAIFVDSASNVWVADSDNSRVMRFSPPFSNGMNANLVLGQPDFTSFVGAISANSLLIPSGLAMDGGGSLWVTDAFYNRVLRFSPPFANGMNANLVLGEPDFTSSGGSTLSYPQGIFIDSMTNVWVTNSNQVSRFSPPFSNGMNPNLTLGTSFLVPPTSASTLSFPLGVAMDSVGNFWVADTNANRVVRYSPPFTNSMSANLALGQTSFVASSSGTAINQVSSPQGIFVDAKNNVWVVDTQNNRILEFNADSPSNLAGSALGVSSVAWSWSTVSGATSYKFYPSSGGAAISLTGTALTETGLSTNSIYGARLSAVGSAGESDPSPPATIYTLAAAPTTFALVQVGLSSIAVSWAANTNPLGTTSYRVDYWASRGSTASLIVQTSSAVLTGLSAVTTYYTAVSALNGNGLAAPSGVLLSTQTSANPVATIGPAGGIVTLAPAAGPIVVFIPPGSIPSPETVTVSAPSAFPVVGSNAATLRGTGVGVQIDLAQSIQPKVPATIMMSYRLSDVSGLDASKLILARYDDTQTVWVPLISSVDTTNQTVTAQTDHFSLFQIMAATPPGTVSAAKAFPNPLRPSQGQANMTFSWLPANSRIRIYNLKGSLIKDLTADGTGMATWDGSNQSGASVASGVYFVFAQGAGQEATLKVAVQR